MIGNSFRVSSVGASFGRDREVVGASFGRDREVAPTISLQLMRYYILEMVLGNSWRYSVRLGNRTYRICIDY